MRDYKNKKNTDWKAKGGTCIKTHACLGFRKRSLRHSCENTWSKYTTLHWKIYFSMYFLSKKKGFFYLLSSKQSPVEFLNLFARMSPPNGGTGLIFFLIQCWITPKWPNACTFFLIFFVLQRRRVGFTFYNHFLIRSFFSILEAKWRHVLVLI